MRKNLAKVHYWSTFVELICTPFQHVALVWGIVPLYFALLLNEMTSTKANFRTAIQTGFSFIWAGAQWLYPYFRAQGATGPHVEWNAMTPVNLLVTFLVLGFGVVALISSLRRRFPKYCAGKMFPRWVWGLGDRWIGERGGLRALTRLKAGRVLISQGG